MTVGEPGSELRALDQPRPEAQPPPPRATPVPAAAPAAVPDGPGLRSLHATLGRLVDALALRALTVVVDDPDLGRQAFRAGPGPFEPGVLAGPPGCHADPPLPPERVAAALVIELCLASLRLEIERGDEGAGGMAAAELALRRLPGVHAVVVEHEDDVMLVQVHAGADAPPDLARAVARASAPLRESRVVVEVVRGAGLRDTPPAPEPASGPAVEPGGGREPVPPTPPEGMPPPPGRGAPSVVAVRNEPESGELEIHVTDGRVRTIGRAPMAEGLAGAVQAALDALRGVEPGLDLSLGWVRTLETTAARRFVVAVSLLEAGDQVRRHGLASGQSAIEAAAHAALDAVTRGRALP